VKVAITGGSGFIGTNLMLYFAKTEPDTEVVIVDTAIPQVTMPENCRYVYADIRNLASLIMAFEDVDEVYNLAGILGTSELLMIPSLAAEVNINGAANVLDACRLMGVKRVYNVAKPFFDSFAENAYTATKHAGELYGQMYQEQFGMEIATVRWLNAVGPHQHLYPVRKFVPMMVLLALYGHDLEVYGDGSQTIDPIDTRDLARFTIHATRNLGRSRTVVDLGSGKDVSCQSAAETILKMAQKVEPLGYTDSLRSKIVNVPMRDGEKPGVNLVADMTYWNSVGMEPEFSFEDSIDAVIEYIVDLPEHVRQNALKFYDVGRKDALL
jgi:nucleoside-diphosphate-sugar epimerase